VTTPTFAVCLHRDAQRLQQALGLEWALARFECGLLLTRACGVERSWLLAHDEESVPQSGWLVYDAWLSRRLLGEPVAYLLGEREFYGHVFEVNVHVLIPRPDTELLVEQALAVLPFEAGMRVLDLGTGSGAVAVSIAIARPAAHVLAVDFSASALQVARQNAKRLKAVNIDFAISDWWQAITDQLFDAIVSNPPYVAVQDMHLQQGDVRFEPLSALVAGEDGLDDLRTIIQRAPLHLKPKGHVLLEHGYEQGEAVRMLLQQAGFSRVDTYRDLAGNERVSIGCWLP
jgi:release factor glutamine methyltransferase